MSKLTIGKPEEGDVQQLTTRQFTFVRGKWRPVFGNTIGEALSPDIELDDNAESISKLLAMISSERRSGYSYDGLNFCVNKGSFWRSNRI